MRVEKLTKYTPEIGARVRELLIQLSRSGKDKGEIPEEWFNDIVNSPFHDLLIAVEDTNTDGEIQASEIMGFASLSVVMGPGVRKNAYLEDFVTDANVRGRGVGSALWEAMQWWAREKGCRNLEFTCGNGREAAQQFYKNHGAAVYETNFFRKGIEG